MPQLTSRQASVYAAVVFVITVALAYFFPGYSITLGGLLVVIFLSVFVESISSTLIAGMLSGIVVAGFMFWYSQAESAVVSWTEFLFLLALIFFTTLIVLYIKALVQQREYDKSHMASLFENATEGIILTNHRAEIILVNPAACRMFGYESATEMVGQKIELLIPRRYRTGHVALRDGFYKTPSNREMGSGRDLFGQRKDGSNFPVEVSLSSYKQRNSQFVIAFVVDITHRKEIEQSMVKQQQELEKVTNDIRRLNTELEAKVEERTLILKEALQKLEQSQAELSEALDKEKQLNEIKSRFVSMASHEFRTPLSAVLSSASLVAKYTTTEEQDKRTRHINRIRESVKHLNDLLEDFLSLGKLDEGKVGANPVTFNLKEKVMNVTDDMRGILKEGQQLVPDHQGPEELFTDRNLVRNILINLISNAVKFSDPGSTIFLTTRVVDDTVTIIVADQGIGIAQEDQLHLFSTFFRGKNALNIQGTGLGLHIVKRYVDLLGGTIGLTSQLGEGTTITINFPKNLNHHGKEDPGN